MTEREIFLAAIDLAEPTERAAYLDEACGRDATLRECVEALLRSHKDAGCFLDSPVVAVPTPDVTGAFGPSAPGTVDPRSSDSATGTFAPDRTTGSYAPDGVTGTIGSAPSAPRATGRAAGAVIAGRYALVKVIGEGGMGTVYRADQTEPVKRQVALKLIKSGMDSRAVLARFDAERQALALMDHPNIARVYDGGTTSTGQPFFVMELVNGVPITEYCDRARLPVRARLELFVVVCQAVQHAHQKGIIHRDLKPSNVLVTEVDGRPTPKVIDFGVAKATEFKLTDQSYVDTGAIVGTPAYISPEQADPSMDIDTRTDIYALGVILYELLVGSPPIESKQFKRGAYLEMLRIVREVEPPRPSTKLSTAEALPNIAANRNLDPAQLKRAVRGDLDWIVMKALEKDRTRRYDTANGFAADVLRHLSHEPVLAAPPSRVYRTRKFVRKNRGAVIAASLVVLTLLAGMAGTTWGLIRAEDEAEKARQRESDAKKSEADAVAARNDLVTTNTKLTASQDELRKSSDSLLSSVARSVLRPLAVQVQPNQPLPPLNDQEIEPLWELASSKDERLRFRFVEVALQDPVSTRQLKDRAAVALQAAVGLNGTGRKQLEELLGNRLQEKAISPVQQEHVALCLAQLGGLDQRLAGRTAATLTRALSHATDRFTLESLSEGLSAVAARMDPKDAAAALALAMSKTTDMIAMRILSQGLSRVAARMEPKEAAKACDQAAATLTQAMSKTTDPNTIWHLSQGLSAVARYVESKEAAEAAVTLTQAMSKSTDLNALRHLVFGLLAVAARIEPKEAAQVCGRAAITLNQAMSKTAQDYHLELLSLNLSLVTARMEPEEAAKACGQAAANLTQAWSKAPNSNTIWHLSRGISAVVGNLESKEAAEAAGTLTQVMSKTTNPAALKDLIQSLLAVAARMEPKEAAQTCGQAAITLTQALLEATDPAILRAVSEGLSRVAARMEPNEAAEAAAALAQTMSKTTDHSTLQAISESLSAMGTRMEPKEAAQTCGQAAATLTQAMSKTRDPIALLALSKGLSAVAAHMESKEAARTSGQAAVILTQAISKATDPISLSALSNGLSAAAAHMEPKEAAQACGQAAATLTQAMSKAAQMSALQSLSYSLSVVAAYMEPKEAARACGQAAATLTQAMSKATQMSALQSLSYSLSVVAAYMEPKEAARACAQAVTVLTQASGKATEKFDFQNLWQGLAAVAGYLEPKEAAEAAAILAQATIKTTNTNALHASLGLVAVAERMEPKEAAAILTQVMNKSTDPNALESLSSGLSRVVARMEPKEAAQACGQAAVILTQVMSKTTNALQPPSLQPLWQGLSMVLGRSESFSPRRRRTSVTAAFASLGGLGSPFGPFAWVQLAMNSAPPPLPPQTLVDILKNPFCVGEARRLVVEQLSRHYNRPFADQWEFEEYVHKHKLDLDLTSPPERPVLP